MVPRIHCSSHGTHPRLPRWRQSPDLGSRQHIKAPPQGRQVVLHVSTSRWPNAGHPTPHTGKSHMWQAKVRLPQPVAGAGLKRLVGMGGLETLTDTVRLHMLPEPAQSTEPTSHTPHSWECTRTRTLTHLCIQHVGQGTRDGLGSARSSGSVCSQRRRPHPHLRGLGQVQCRAVQQDPQALHAVSVVRRLQDEGQRGGAGGVPAVDVTPRVAYRSKDGG